MVTSIRLHQGSFKVFYLISMVLLIVFHKLQSGSELCSDAHRLVCTENRPFMVFQRFLRVVLRFLVHRSRICIGIARELVNVYNLVLACPLLTACVIKFEFQDVNPSLHTVTL
jgi:hypothetical protein